MAFRTASAEWNGDLPSGAGRFQGASGELAGAYSFQSRFGDENAGTNPEELLAAAHASCFSMALSNGLAEAGTTPESIKTEAKAQLVKDGAGPAIAKIELTTVGRVPGLDQAGFEQAAQAAKEGCPVSKALAGVGEITLSATLED